MRLAPTVYTSRRIKHSMNGVRDTYICFSGPGQIIPPDQRSIPFKLITADKLPMLATDDEPSGARIIRLMLKNVSSKQSNNRPSPAKAKGNPNWRRNADDSDDDGESDAPDDAEGGGEIGRVG